jgi:hypothetical protein
VLDNPKGADFKKLDLQKILNIISTGEVAPTGQTANTGIGSVSEGNEKYPVLVRKEEWKKEYNTTVQKYAKVSATTPVADQLRADLKSLGSFIIEKGDQLSNNGDITQELRTAILSFANKIQTTTGFGFINSTTPLVITAGNDTFHRTYGEKRNRSSHCRGLAIDIRTREWTQPQIDSVQNLLRASGFVWVDYHGPVFHIHANISTT